MNIGNAHIGLPTSLLFIRTTYFTKMTKSFDYVFAVRMT